MPRRLAKRGHLETDRLFSSLAEQIRLPLLQIARRAELANQDAQLVPEAMQDIESAASSALRLVDTYLFTTEILSGQLQLEFEPLSISSVFNDAAQVLASHAKRYDCDIELDLKGANLRPVMANRRALSAAFIGLGLVFIEAQSQQQEGRTVLTLAAHKAPRGTAAGVFASADGLGRTLYHRALKLYGRARQPLNNFTAGSGAGVFLADSIFRALNSELKVSRHNKLTGLAATLLPSSQLKLI